MRVFLLYNPVAGAGHGQRQAQRAAGVLTEAGWRVELAGTSGPSQAEQLARQAAEEGVDLVVACGGDGTFCQAARGLAGSGVPLGLVPAGTGNDLARSLGIAFAPVQAARQLLLGAASHMDLLRVNEGLLAANIVGTGFDAAVAERITHRSRFATGKLAYLTAVLQELSHFSPCQLKLQVDGHRWEGRALLVAFANAQSYGAGMKIAPKAELEDGLMDVVVVSELPKYAFLWHLPKVFSGRHLGLKGVHYFQGRQAELEAERQLPVLVDGDLEATTPLHIEVAHRALLVWRPGPLAGTGVPLPVEA